MKKSVTVEHVLEHYEEHAGKMEYEAEWSREDAEVLAREYMCQLYGEKWRRILNDKKRK